MKDTLLFSDVHLKPSAADQTNYTDFIAFLRQINPDRVERVICLGDLFDFWFEYKHAMFACYFDVLRIFAGLRDAGIETHLICGNHDLWAGPQLERMTGMQVHHEPVTLPFGSDTALLLHGDGLNPKDYGYRMFKRLSQNRLAQRLFRHLHPDTAMGLAHWISRGSRAMAAAPNPADSPEVRIVRDHALERIGRGQAAVVICGHAHVPAVEPVTVQGHSGLYVNPGDWPLHRSFVRYVMGEFRLESFCSNT